MQEINQKISQLIDDELDIRQAQTLLRRIQGDPALQAKLQRLPISHNICFSTLKYVSTAPISPT